MSIKDLQPIELDLLNGKSGFEINDSLHWALVSSSKIGDFSVDAQTRYQQLTVDSEVRQYLQPLVWGGEYGGWQPAPIQKGDDRVDGQCWGGYGDIWIREAGGKLSSSHGTVKCEYE